MFRLVIQASAGVVDLTVESWTTNLSWCKLTQAKEPSGNSKICLRWAGHVVRCSSQQGRPWRSVMYTILLQRCHDGIQTLACAEHFWRKLSCLTHFRHIVHMNNGEVFGRIGGKAWKGRVAATHIQIPG